MQQLFCHRSGLKKRKFEIESREGKRFTLSFPLQTELLNLANKSNFHFLHSALESEVTSGQLAEAGFRPVRLVSPRVVDSLLLSLYSAKQLFFLFLFFCLLLLLLLLLTIRMRILVAAWGLNGSQSASSCKPVISCLQIVYLSSVPSEIMSQLRLPGSRTTGRPMHSCINVHQQQMMPNQSSDGDGDGNNNINSRRRRRLVN